MEALLIDLEKYSSNGSFDEFITDKKKFRSNRSKIFEYLESLSKDELNDVIPGDSVDLQILFEVENMVPIKEIRFKIGFNGELFKPNVRVF